MNTAFIQNSITFSYDAEIYKLTPHVNRQEQSGEL